MLEELLAKRFIERRDVKAVQHSEGAYAPVRESWKMGDLRAHLAGEKSYGHYLISEEGNTKLFAFDIDLKKTGFYPASREDGLIQTGPQCNPRELWKDPDHPSRPYFTKLLRSISEGLAIRTHRISGGDFPVAVAYSGNKGFHVYGFMGSTPAEEARGMALEIIKSFNCFEPSKGNNFWVHSGHKGFTENLEIEIFPKQDNLDGKELGNLMRLALGVNQKSGQKAFFVDTRCGLDELRELDPLLALNGEYPWGEY